IAHFLLFRKIADTGKVCIAGHNGNAGRHSTRADELRGISFRSISRYRRGEQNYSPPIGDTAAQIAFRPRVRRPKSFHVAMRSSAGADEIALADFHAVVAQNVVGGGGMKVEVRQGEMAEKLLPLQRQGLVRAGGKAHVAVLGAVEL